VDNPDFAVGFPMKDVRFLKEKEAGEIMRVIELDASGCKSILDFLEALKTAIGAPKWHGTNLNALVDSMIWGGINSIEPPYTVKITNTGSVPGDVAEVIRDLASYLRKQREWRLLHRGDDVAVSIEAPELQKGPGH
jgi:hypothetical protein